MRVGIMAAVLAAATGFAGTALAAGGPLAVSKINLYMIWEGTGQLSENLADRTDQIVVVKEGDSASQFIVDLVVEGAPGLYEDAPELKVEVVRPYGTDDSLMLAKSYSIGWLHDTGKLYTSLTVEHGCDGFTINAWIERGGVAGETMAKDVSVNCGD